MRLIVVAKDELHRFGPCGGLLPCTGGSHSRTHRLTCRRTTGHLSARSLHSRLSLTRLGRRGRIGHLTLSGPLGIRGLCGILLELTRLPESLLLRGHRTLRSCLLRVRGLSLWCACLGGTCRT